MLKRAVILIFIAGLMFSLTGCNLLNWMAYVLIPPPPPPTVKAEYTGLEKGMTVCILIYADAGTLYEQPYACLDVAEFVGREMVKRLKVNIVNNRKVTTFQETTLNWEEIPLAQIGKRFNADVVCYIELLEYSTQDDLSANLYRGRLHAGCMLVGIKGEDKGMKLWKGRIQAIWPPPKTAAKLDSSDYRVRHQTLATFADRLVKKFYTHQEGD